jgi:hypothetical protein
MSLNMNVQHLAGQPIRRGGGMKVLLLDWGGEVFFLYFIISYFGVTYRMRHFDTPALMNMISILLES